MADVFVAVAAMPDAASSSDDVAISASVSEPSASAPGAAVLPNATFSLTSAAKFLYSEQQRQRSETTDDGISPYLLQRRKFYQPEQWATLLNQLAHTRTLYVGNLSFYTTEEQLWCFFSQVGRVVRIVMGLNERSMTPCGFCFVEFSTHSEALDCQRHLSGLMCDERVVRADLDPGFEEGRQYGRSKLTGGQIRDDHRKDFDPGRGGYVVNQPTTFASLIPGIITIRPSRSRKRQRIDLAAVRAQRKAARTSGGPPAGAASARPGPARSGEADKQRVGSKRRRDEDEEMEEEQDADAVAEEEKAGDRATGVGAAEDVDADGDADVDEVVTSGAEGDVESAAEADGDGHRTARTSTTAAPAAPSTT